MKDNQLRICYKGSPDQSLDAAIKALLKVQGYEFYASGYNFESDERDLAFEITKKD